jgi:Protein of unknown function (DUF3237)
MTPKAPLTADPLMQIDLEVWPPIQIGIVGGQNRRCIPIIGGVVTGNYTGKVMSSGADWQQIEIDGTLEIDARYVLQLSEGLVEVESRGLRAGPPEVMERLAKGEVVDPALYYFRTAIRFRTAAPALVRLNHMLAISVGERLPDAVRLTVYEVA